MRERSCITRRMFLKESLSGALAASSIFPLHARTGTDAGLPTSPVGIARCRRYDFNLIKSALSDLFDQIGGVQSLVSGKTVSVKINLTGGWNVPTYTLPIVQTFYTHPLVTLAACRLFYEYGAKRIIICESLYTNDEKRAAYTNYGYSVTLFESTVPNLVWEDTHNSGAGGTYRALPVGNRAYLYSSFQFNHCYVDTDVVVSIPKMKNHLIAGITLSLKNMVGSTPSALYSSSNDDELTTSSRENVLHNGGLSAAGGEVLPIPSTDPGYRMPRVVVDIVRARPIDLCIIDGVVTTYGGEGPWHNTRVGIAIPALLIAGKNAVCTDTVAAAVMGYDPQAPDGSKPFVNGSNMLRLAAESGLGTNRLADIDVVGLSTSDAHYTFPPTYKSRESYP
jgi:uncharacterized protein (DUF362 family)